MRRALARTGLRANLVCADALRWTPPTPFDAVLLDAPCSATGTLRRHPEAAWLRTPAHIVAFANTQSALLAAARAFVKDGGRLVYVVCSLEPEEGPAIVAEALSQGGWRRDPIQPCEVGNLQEVLTDEGDLRTFPHHLADRGGMDGFFAARLVRVDR